MSKMSDLSAKEIQAIEQLTKEFQNFRKVWIESKLMLALDFEIYEKVKDNFKKWLDLYGAEPSYFYQVLAMPY